MGFRCSIRNNFLEVRPGLDEIFESVQPKFHTAIPGIFTFGREEYVEPSEENPVVVVVRVHYLDRQWAALVHDRVGNFVCESFTAPIPPFRWIVHETAPYFDSPPSLSMRGHRRESSQQYYHDTVSMLETFTRSHQRLF